jgi:hypothetical protein
LLAHPGGEISTFSDAEVSRLLASGAFPTTAIIRAHDTRVRSDFISVTWVCFLAYPFTIGFKYPFPSFVSDFFRATGLSYAQAMPVVWRILHVLNHLVEDLGLDIRVSDLATLYNLRTHGSSRFVLQLIRKEVCPVFKTTKNEDAWKNKFFFVKRASIPGGPDLPMKWPTKGRVRNPG